MSPTRRPNTPPRVSVEVSPAYELLMSLLVAFSEGDGYERDLPDTWITQVRDRAGADLVARIGALGGDDCETFTHLTGLVYDTPAPQTVPAFLDHLRQTDAHEILLHLVQFYAREIRRMTPPSVIRAAVSGDTDAQAEFIKTSYPEWADYLRMVFARDPEELKTEIVDVLEQWSNLVWKAEALTIMPILERDAEAKRDLLRDLPIDRFIPTATNGVEFSPRPGIERLVMIPSFLNRPLVTYVEFGETMLIAYPVADESVTAETDAPPLRLVRLSKALGDEKRLRILRVLADGEKSLMELADLFGVAKTTMHHHMIILRSAGLVSASVGSKRYRLRSETIPDVGALLGSYLATSPAPSAPRTPRTGTEG